MTPALAVGRRETAALFSSSTGWVVTTAFLFWNGFAYLSLVDAYADPGGVRHSFGEAVTAPLAMSLALGLVLFVPLLAMGSFADERRAGSEDLLFSLPLAESEIVLGKFAGLLLPVWGLLTVPLLYPVPLAPATSIDWGQLAAAWIGLLLAASLYLAVGLWISARTESRIGAAVVTLVTLLVWFFADRLLPGGGEGAVRAFAERLSLRLPLERFGRGVVSSGDIVFHVAAASCFLFSAARSLARRRTGR